MINAPYDKEFVFQDGRRAKNFLELSEILNNISDQDFKGFVNSSKNDFASWIEYVLMDKKLSDKLRSTTSKEITLDFLRDHIKMTEKEQDHKSFTIKQDHGSQPHILYVKKDESKEQNEHKHDHAEHEHMNEHKEEMHKEAAASETHAKNKWYEFSKKKHSTENDHMHTSENAHDKEKEKEEKHAEKHVDEHGVDEKDKSAHHEKNSGHTFWIILYGVIILLIVALIVYKFVLGKSFG